MHRLRLAWQGGDPQSRSFSFSKAIAFSAPTDIHAQALASGRDDHCGDWPKKPLLHHHFGDRSYGNSYQPTALHHAVYNGLVRN